jgi:hypothetical protein
MAERNKPWAIDGNTHPGQDIRIASGAMLGCDQTVTFAGGVPASGGLLVDPGHGVCGFGDLKVTQNGSPNMSVNIAAGTALIRGTQSALQGVYSVANDATDNVTIAASNPTNPRRDLIIAQVRDNAFDAGGINDFRITVVTGTPAASPVDPSLTSFPNALVLARVTVAAAVTSIVNGNITDLRSIAAPWANGRGGIDRKSITANQGSIGTSLTDVTGLSITFNARAGRRYEISGHFQMSCTTGGSQGNINVDKGGTSLAYGAALMSTGVGATCLVFIEDVPGAGSVTYKARTNVSAGTGTVLAGPTFPGHLRVEDVGGVLN